MLLNNYCGFMLLVSTNWYYRLTSLYEKYWNILGKVVEAFTGTCTSPQHNIPSLSIFEQKLLS